MTRSLVLLALVSCYQPLGPLATPNDMTLHVAPEYDRVSVEISILFVIEAWQRRYNVDLSDVPMDFILLPGGSKTPCGVLGENHTGCHLRKDGRHMMWAYADYCYINWETLSHELGHTVDKVVHNVGGHNTPSLWEGNNSYEGVDRGGLGMVEEIAGWLDGQKLGYDKEYPWIPSEIDDKIEQGFDCSQAVLY